MAKEPDDVVLRILREIQASLAEHTRMHKEHASAFRKAHQEIADLRDATISSAGLAVHANVKAGSLQALLDSFGDRSSSLERKVEVVEHEVDERV